MFEVLNALFTNKSKRPDIGDVIPVGEFFWITDDAMIGFAPGAVHGHGLSCSSADVGCTVKVIDYAGSTHVAVELDRPEVPYGALAPIGTVFFLPLAQLYEWPAMLAADKNTENKKNSLMQKYYG